MKAFVASAAVLLLAGCGTFSSDSINVEGAKGYAACIEGSGPPLTGAGHYARAKVDKNFVGEIIVTKGCDIKIRSDKP